MTRRRAFWSGLLVGLAEAVPGVSGASAALLLGAYDRALERAAGLLRGARRADGPDARPSGLWPALAGLALALACWPLVVLPLQQAFPEPLRAVLLGLACAGLVRLLARPASWKAHHASLLVLSAMLSWRVLGQQPPEDAPEGGLLHAVGGVSFSAALALPGVPGLQQLPLFGAHAGLLDAGCALARGRPAEALATAWPFLLGAAVGLAATVLCLAWLLRHHRDLVRALLLGFYAGALHRLWPFREDTVALLLGRARVVVADQAVAPPLAAPATWAVLGLALAAFVLALRLLPPLAGARRAAPVAADAGHAHR